MKYNGFRSQLVLAKIGYDLRNYLLDTLEEPVEGVFGPFIDALNDANGVLSLSNDEYRCVSNDNSFQFSEHCKQSTCLRS